MMPSPLAEPPVAARGEPPPRRKPYISPNARRLIKRTRDLIQRIRALELDYAPDDVVSVPMKELSYLASAVACSDAMLDECRKSRLQILQSWATAAPN